jgi:hypothetical protein
MRQCIQELNLVFARQDLISLGTAGASSVGGSGAEGSGGVAHNSSSSRVQDPLACITQLLEWGADPWAPGPGEEGRVHCISLRQHLVRTLPDYGLGQPTAQQG